MNTDQSLRKVLRTIQDANDADAMLLTGDLVQDESRKGYERLKSYVDDLGLPTFSIPGNHDNPDYMTDILAGSKSQVGGHAIMSNWCVILLSSYRKGSASGEIQQMELDRLHDVLTRNHDKHVLVCLHHQPVDMGSRWLDTVGLRNADAFWKVLDNHTNVRCVVWGHVHQEHDSIRRGVRLISTPSTCAQFRPGAKNFEIDETPPAYRWIQLKHDGEVITKTVWIND